MMDPNKHSTIWNDLLQHLREQTADEVVLSFAQIDHLRGVPLPPAVRDGGSLLRGNDKPWSPEGWRTSCQNLDPGHVRFYRGTLDRSRPSHIWDRLLTFLDTCGSNYVELTYDQIADLRGRPMSKKMRDRTRGSLSSRDMPWAERGWWVRLRGLPPDRVAFVRATDPTSGRRPSVWDPLIEHLKALDMPAIRLTFGEIEALTGNPIPPSGHRHEAYWQASKRPWVKHGFWALSDSPPHGTIEFVKLEAGKDKLEPQRRISRHIWEPLIAYLEQLDRRDVVLHISKIAERHNRPLPAGEWQDTNFWSRQGGLKLLGWRAAWVSAESDSVRFGRIDGTAWPRRRGEWAWDGLIRYLEGQDANVVELTYAKIEELRGVPLEHGAWNNRIHYWNQPGKPWRKIGWKSTAGRLPADHVLFFRPGTHALRPPQR